MYHVLSMGRSFLTLFHTKEIDMDTWHMVMGEIWEDGRPGWRWN